MSDRQNSHPGGPTAEAFLDLLEKKDLVPRSVLATLRKQVAQSKAPIAAERVAKLLVDKQVLTPAIAQRLLAAQGKPAPKPPPGPAAKSPSPKPAIRQPAAADRGSTSLLDEELPPLAAGLPPLAAELPPLAASGPLDALMSDPSLANSAETAIPFPPLGPPKRNLFQSLIRQLRPRGRRPS